MAFISTVSVRPAAVLLLGLGGSADLLHPAALLLISSQAPCTSTAAFRAVYLLLLRCCGLHFHHRLHPPRCRCCRPPPRLWRLHRPPPSSDTVVNNIASPSPSTAAFWAFYLPLIGGDMAFVFIIVHCRPPPWPQRLF
jgi:hypothetical protein